MSKYKLGEFNRVAYDHGQSVVQEMRSADPSRSFGRKARSGRRNRGGSQRLGIRKSI